MTDEDEDAFDPSFSSLDTSRVPVLDEDRIKAEKAKIQFMLDNVKLDLEERGIPEPPRPSGHPRALADLDINILTNSEVASLYTQYVAYASYIGDELAQIEGLESSAKKMLRDVLSELKDKEFAAGFKGAEASAAAMRSPIYRELDIEHAKLFFMKTIMTRRYRGYITQAAALSRCIELRKLDFEQQRRDSNTGFGPRRPSVVKTGSSTPRPTGVGAPKKP